MSSLGEVLCMWNEYMIDFDLRNSECIENFM